MVPPIALFQTAVLLAFDVEGLFAWLAWRVNLQLRAAEQPYQLLFDIVEVINAVVIERIPYAHNPELFVPKPPFLRMLSLLFRFQLRWESTFGDSSTVGEPLVDVGIRTGVA